MPTTWIESYVKCPFYKYEDGKKSITCEGISDACITRVIFVTKEKQRVQLQKTCCGDYKKCPFYKILMEKYE